MNLPLNIFALPVLLIIIVVVAFVTKRFLDNGKWTLSKFTLVYWGILITIEIILLIYTVINAPVQYLPSSLLINYICGTPFFIYFMVQCILSKVHIKEKITFILYAVLLNYIILPFGLIWL